MSTITYDSSASEGSDWPQFSIDRSSAVLMLYPNLDERIDDDYALIEKATIDFGIHLL